MRAVRYLGSKFWLFSAAISFFGSLSFLALALPFPDMLPPALGMALFGGSLFFFMAAMLTSALGMMTLLLRGFEPDARLAIAGRMISDATMTGLLVFFYLPPWIVLMGFGYFVRR